METKPIHNFVLEIWEVESYYQTERGWKIVFDYRQQHFIKEQSNHFNLSITGIKKVFEGKYPSQRKLHRAMGIKKGHYHFYKHINEFIKGQWGSYMHCLKLNQRYVFIVRQLHDLDTNYFI